MILTQRDLYRIHMSLEDVADNSKSYEELKTDSGDTVMVSKVPNLKGYTISVDIRVEE